MGGKRLKMCACCVPSFFSASLPHKQAPKKLNDKYEHGMTRGKVTFSSVAHCGYNNTCGLLKSWFRVCHSGRSTTGLLPLSIPSRFRHVIIPLERATRAWSACRFTFFNFGPHTFSRFRRRAKLIASTCVPRDLFSEPLRFFCDHNSCQYEWCDNFPSFYWVAEQQLWHYKSQKGNYYFLHEIVIDAEPVDTIVLLLAMTFNARLWNDSTFFHVLLNETKAECEISHRDSEIGYCPLFATWSPE